MYYLQIFTSYTKTLQKKGRQCYNSSFGEHNLGFSLSITSGFKLKKCLKINWLKWKPQLEMHTKILENQRFHLLSENPQSNTQYLLIASTRADHIFVYFYAKYAVKNSFETRPYICCRIIIWDGTNHSTHSRSLNGNVSG